jgi:uncharacterized membrane protein (DUF373 family)
VLAKLARISLQTLEVLTVVILTVLTLFALAGLVMEVPAIARPPFLDTAGLSAILDHLLGVFVLIELLVIAVAYLRGSEVVRRIFEAVLVALARKLISTEAMSLTQAGALALLLATVGLTWFLIAKGEAARHHA